MDRFEPYVRYGAKTSYYIGGKYLIARDCHLLYIISGKGTFETGDKSVALSPQTLIYYPYGKKYRLSEDSDILFYTVNFDFDSDGVGITSMTPQNAELYKNPIESLSSAPSDIFQNELVFSAAGWAENAMRGICEETKKQMPYYSQISGAYIKLLCYEIMRRFCDGDNPLCREIKTAVAENVQNNNLQIAAKLGYHPYYIGDVFRKNEGMTLHRYIIQQRLILAYDKITSTKLSLEEISELCGFSSPAHLSSSFRSAYGFSPSNLRRRG